MGIKIIAATKNPLDVISFCAGVCYGKRNVSTKRVETCYNRGHLSVFEHASFTALIEGISRACSHQLVRHRLASYSQESQRYCKIEGKSWYVIPPEIDADANLRRTFELDMAQCRIDYNKALESGGKPEDARFLLPEATKTSIVVTMNVRELFHFLDERQNQAAQWEIRALAYQLESELKSYNDQWAQIIELRGKDGK